MKANPSRILIVSVLGIATVFFGILFCAWTVVPYLQMNRYYAGIRAYMAGNKKAVTDERIFSPITYAGPKLRSALLSFAINQYQDRGDADAPVSFAIAQYEALGSMLSHDPQYFLTLARGYTVLAKMTRQYDEYLGLAESYYAKALSLWPGSPDIIFEYVTNLVNRRKVAEAVALARKGVEENPKLLNMRYYLGYALYQSGPAGYD
jgi:hypothetical protein